MVFLFVRGGNGVHGTRSAQLLVLADDGGSSILRNHEPGVQSRIGNQEFGDVAAVARNQAVGAAFGNASQFRHGDGEEVHYQCQGLPVEVASGDNQVILHEDGRVVRYGVDFAFHDGCHVHDAVFAGAVYLRHAAEGIGVLHPCLFFLLEFGTFQQGADVACRLDLSRMGTGILDLRQEGIDASVVRL